MTFGRGKLTYTAIVDVTGVVASCDNNFGRVPRPYLTVVVTGSTVCCLDVATTSTDSAPTRSQNDGFSNRCGVAEDSWHTYN